MLERRLGAPASRRIKQQMRNEPVEQVGEHHLVGACRGLERESDPGPRHGAALGLQPGAHILGEGTP